MPKLSSILSQFGKPATIAAALAFGFLSGADTFAQSPSQDSQQLQRLLNEKDHRFSDVPLLRDRVSEAQPLQAKPFKPGATQPARSYRPNTRPQHMLGGLWSNRELD